MASKVPTFVVLAAFLTTLLAVPSFLHCSTGAADPHVLRSGGLVVVVEESLEPIAGRLRDIYPKLRDDLEAIFGWKLQSKPTVKLIRNRDVFEKMSGSPHFSALAVPSRDLIVMLVTPATSRSFTLAETFKHELCHLLLHDHIPDSLLPKWLDEGICQWVSGSLGEILSGDGFPVPALELARHAIPLWRLAHTFPRDKDALSLAYEESRRFVEYLTANYGKQGLVDILRHLAQGDEIDQAFMKALSKSLGAVEEEWLESIKGKGAWLIWASQHLYDILFFIAALLTVLAFVRLVVRRKHHVEDDEGE